MDRRDIIKRLLYPKCKTAVEFKFDTLTASPLLSYITIQDITRLHKIATSVKYSSKPKEKYLMIDKILVPRGFKKMASGTNRVTYRFLNDYSVVLKVAIDKVGLSDNGNEYRNQNILKPFVTKCFEVSPCGTVGLFERVVPITSREEFINISEDIFDLINNLIGKYVLEDIGEKFYMNYGLREGFGPVLLDYPYVFELDGRKLICNVPDPIEPNGYCGGEIDYDLGYNNLICRKCGKRYLATELKSDSKSENPKIIIKGDDIIMKCVLMRGNDVVSDLNSKGHVSTNTIKSKKEFNNLKAKLTDSVPVSDSDDTQNYKHFQVNDDVQLKVRLKGSVKTKNNIDKIAIEKQQIADANTRKINVAFDKVEEPKDDIESDLSTIIIGKDERKEKTTYDAILENVVEEGKNTKMEEQNKSEIDKYQVIIKDDTEIWDIVNNKLIGYTRKGVDEEIKRYVDFIFENNDGEEDLEYDDEPSESIANAIIEYAGNDNYKTDNVTSPIEQHFSSVEINDKEDNENEDLEYDDEPSESITDTEDKIPEVIINSREESDNIDLY